MSLMDKFDREKAAEAFRRHSWMTNETIGLGDVWCEGAKWQHAQDSALLSNITPIEKEDTAEGLLRELISYEECLREQRIRCSDEIPDIADRARKFLKRGEK